MIFSIAWKNVWRNKLRSSIVIASMVIGLIGGIFYLAFAKGMAQQQVNSAIHSEISNIQIHNPEFLINNEISFTINNADEKVKKIKTINGVKEAACRITSAAMASSAITGTGIFVNGIDYKEEEKVTNISTLLVSGTYFNVRYKNPIVVGEKLAEKLKVKIGSKIVITIQNIEGEIAYSAFRIAGIYKTHNSNYDLMNVFVTQQDLTNIIGINPNSATEIAVLLNHNLLTRSVSKEIKKLFSKEISQKFLVVRTWEDISPVLKMLNEMTIQYSMIFVIIILVALSFGIINTMLMAIMERVREIGMLMAIGMSKVKVFFMITLETVFLSITGGVLGLSISWILVEIMGISGIDLSSIADGLNSMGYSSYVYPELDLIYYGLIGLLVVVTAIFASIMPARKALKFNPAQAVRHDA
ncbi:MAG: FtsX-like permease family protein [Bacteroidetes bacterium]|nr:FtsX-like permease family protein [Bacteroidota bacterium]MBU1116695.1 FtsX-like permease family protein [Bacteroidota bacterium]MBU1800059.1 FtsX-like permease family protein [Bacteroidota bacterium]